MRTITLALILHNQPNTVRPTYALTLHDKQQDDLQVRPLFSVSLQRPNVVSRMLTVWPMGIQVGKYVLRFGYVCAGMNAVDDTVHGYWHPGPRQAAIEHFHALFGPKWSVRLDGVLGYFTTMLPVEPTGGEVDSGHVMFKLGLPKLAEPSEVIKAAQDHRAAHPGGLMSQEELPHPPVSDAPATPENTGIAYPDTAFEHEFGHRLRSQLRVKLISRFGVDAEGAASRSGWLMQFGASTVERLTAREAEKALAAFDAEERFKARNKNPG